MLLLMPQLAAHMAIQMFFSFLFPFASYGAPSAPGAPEDVAFKFAANAA